MIAYIFTHNDHGKVLLICLILSFNKIDGKKIFDFFLNDLGFTLTKRWNLSQRVFFVWNCSDSPFLEVCKLTDLMAVKVRRFIDLGVVLVKYYRAKSSNG